MNKCGCNQNMSLEQKVEFIKSILSRGETCCVCAPFDDSVIENMLEFACGNVYAVLYDLLLRMAENDSLSLPDGTSIPNNEKYWLRLAARYRPNKGGVIIRADEVMPNECGCDTEQAAEDALQTWPAEGL